MFVPWQSGVCLWLILHAVRSEPIGLKNFFPGILKRASAQDCCVTLQ